VVEFVRDTIVSPSVGALVQDLTPLLLTMFFFIPFANAIGLVPIFDVLALADHSCCTPRTTRSRSASSTAAPATGNPNVTAGLAIVTFFTIAAAAPAHGFVKHWKNWR
jgi:F0F1-type ATP synthase membrane subunit a